jgi:EpsD family peptidyl-prolyl cis-trans isomerase
MRILVMSRHALLLSAFALAVAGGCGKKTEQAGTVPEEKLAATVDGWSVTRAQVADYVSHLPEAQRYKYDTPEGRAELAEKLMQEEISYREAKKEKLGNNEEVKKQIEDATRSILVGAYLAEKVDVKARPSEEEIHTYYETHQDLYTTLEIIRAQQVFSKDKKKLEDIKRRVEEGGEKFTTMAHMYSEDELTRSEGGDMGSFNPGGYIKGVGYSQTYTDQIVTMEPGKIYGPIKWERGYSLVRVNEKRPPTLKPYDEVHDEIVDRLAREKLEAVRAAHFAEVEKNYSTRNYMEEEYQKTQRGPAELFEYAQNTAEPLQRIAAFQEIVDKYPTDKFAPQALFMIGFVYAEEVRDYAMAGRAFDEVVEKYPDSDMAQTAKWMLDNLSEPLPKFEDLDDLNRQIEKKTD